VKITSVLAGNTELGDVGRVGMVGMA
jgi:hypothetical protein